MHHPTIPRLPNLASPEPAQTYVAFLSVFISPDIANGSLFRAALFIFLVGSVRLRNLPVTLSSCSLKAIWLSENQVQPSIKFQQEFDDVTGQMALTCFLLPQPGCSQLVSTASRDFGEGRANCKYTRFYKAPNAASMCQVWPRAPCMSYMVRPPQIVSVRL